MKVILKNMVRCHHCGDVIESKHRHDFRSCSCGDISVDGGLDYLRRVGDLTGFEEFSTMIEVNKIFYPGDVVSRGNKDEFMVILNQEIITREDDYSHSTHLGYKVIGRSGDFQGKMFIVEAEKLRNETIEEAEASAEEWAKDYEEWLEEKKMEIKDTNGALLWSGEAASMKEACEKAVKQGVSLAFADLRGADLRGANLERANLYGAYLYRAYLRDAYLFRANLRGADLSGADLSGADLSGAYLRDAYLSGADLRGAYLRDAYLSGADLSGANLYRAKWK